MKQKIKKSYYESLKNRLEIMLNETSRIILQWEKDFDLGFINEIELLEKKENWFKEYYSIAFDVWEYDLFYNLKKFKNSLHNYIDFKKTGQTDGMIDIINEAPVPGKPDFKLLETLNTDMIKLCNLEYQSLVSHCKKIPLMKFDKNKFPIRPIDEEPGSE